MTTVFSSLSCFGTLLRVLICLLVQPTASSGPFRPLIQVRRRSRSGNRCVGLEHALVPPAVPSLEMSGLVPSNGEPVPISDQISFPLENSGSCGNGVKADEASEDSESSVANVDLTESTALVEAASIEMPPPPSKAAEARNLLRPPSRRIKVSS